jgi:hypothetical protein
MTPNLQNIATRFEELEKQLAYLSALWRSNPTQIGTLWCGASLWKTAGKGCNSRPANVSALDFGSSIPKAMGELGSPCRRTRLVRYKLSIYM